MRDANKVVPVFVYGTLKKGERAHFKLEGSRFVGTAELQAEYKLLNCGRYPALVKAHNGTNNVPGEIYEVNRKVLKILHDYEGVNSGLYYFDYLALENCEIVNQPEGNLTKKMLNRGLVFGYLFGNQNINLPEISYWSIDSLCSAPTQ